VTFSQKAENMHQSWDEIEKLLNEMQFILVESGIPEHQVKMPQMITGEPADPLRIQTDTYIKAFDWLHNLRMSDQYAGVLKVKSLLPQRIWDMYKLQELRGLQEQFLLETAQRKLRKLWKSNRPTFFGRVYKHVEEETTDADPNSSDASVMQLRSEGAGSDACNCGDGQP
jgi:hypothetical protein